MLFHCKSTWSQHKLLNLAKKVRIASEQELDRQQVIVIVLKALIWIIYVSCTLSDLHPLLYWLCITLSHLVLHLQVQVSTSLASTLRTCISLISSWPPHPKLHLLLVRVTYDLLAFWSCLNCSSQPNHLTMSDLCLFNVRLLSMTTWSALPLLLLHCSLSYQMFTLLLTKLFFCQLLKSKNMTFPEVKQFLECMKATCVAEVGVWDMIRPSFQHNMIVVNVVPVIGIA